MLDLLDASQLLDPLESYHLLEQHLLLGFFHQMHQQAKLLP